MKKLYEEFLKCLRTMFGIEPELSNLKIQIQKQQNQIKNIMTALENLQTSITQLTATVDAVVTDLNTPHPTDAQVQAAADAVNAQITRLQAALGTETPVEG